MIKKPVTIKVSMDMQSRPIAHLVQEASQYSSCVHIIMEDKKINAKSIMGMMSLNLEQGTSVVLMAEGDDEEKAIEGVEKFLTTCR